MTAGWSGRFDRRVAFQGGLFDALASNNVLYTCPRYQITAMKEWHRV